MGEEDGKKNHLIPTEPFFFVILQGSQDGGSRPRKRGKSTPSVFLLHLPSILEPEMVGCRGGRCVGRCWR